MSDPDIDPNPNSRAAEAWVDKHGDVWREGADGLLHTPETAPFSREVVERKWGPLRPVAGLLRERNMRPPAGFLERLYWDELRVSVGAIALFFDNCSANTAYQKFKPQRASENCWGGCGRVLPLVRTSRRDSFSGPRYCDDLDCVRRRTEHYQNRVAIEDYQLRTYIASLLRAGVDLPRYQPETWTCLPAPPGPETDRAWAEYDYWLQSVTQHVSTWIIDDVRREIQDNPRAYKEEPGGR